MSPGHKSLKARGNSGQSSGHRNASNQKPHANKTTTVEVRETSLLQSLVGEGNSNLRVIERELDLRLDYSPEGIEIEGESSAVDLASDLLNQLRDLLAAGEKIFPGDIQRSIKMLAADKRVQLKDLYRDQVRIAGRSSAIVPKTIMQKSYIDAVRAHDVVFGVGPAGTGKTYLAMAMAVNELVRKNIKRVVLCRPAVEAGEKLGFLPGDLAEKVNPYLRPLYDALHDMVDIDRAKEMIERGVIEVAPLAFMRGRTLSNAFVILDEAQNTTTEQMKMLLTRLGQGSKCIITGDITQIDLPRGTKSGLVEALSILKGVEGLSIIYFTKDDIIRHPLVSRIVDAYDRRGQGDQ